MTTQTEAEELIPVSIRYWLTKAMVLAITAPSEEKAMECVQMADSLAAHLTDKEVKDCQAIARRTVDQ